MGKLAALVTETRDQEFQIVAGSASYLLAAMLVGKCIVRYFLLKQVNFVSIFFFLRMLRWNKRSGRRAWRTVV